MACFLTAVLSSLVMSSCITRGYSDSDEIPGDSRFEKLRIADSVVNEEHFRVLRKELGARLPGVRENDLARLRLERVEQEGFDTRESVRVVVSLSLSGNRYPKPIVQAAVELVKADVDRLRKPQGRTGGN